jgi:uncharacterized protein YdaU (DUF1376 family)
MHYYDFNIGDFAKKTQHLTNEEELAYRRALDMYYDTENPLLTTGLATLSRRLRVDEKSLKNVLDEFFPDGRNKHADEKIAEYYAYIEKQKLNGSKGGRPKQQLNKPTANPVDSQNNPVPSQPLPTKPITNNHIKNISPLALLTAMNVSEDLAKDWVKVRKEKKLAITQTALDKIKSHAESNGYTFAEAIKICVEKSWGGFNVKWLDAETVPVKKDEYL